MLFREALSEVAVNEAHTAAGKCGAEDVVSVALGIHPHLYGLLRGKFCAFYDVFRDGTFKTELFHAGFSGKAGGACVRKSFVGEHVLRVGLRGQCASNAGDEGLETVVFAQLVYDLEHLASHGVHIAAGADGAAETVLEITDDAQQVLQLRVTGLTHESRHDAEDGVEILRVFDGVQKREGVFTLAVRLHDLRHESENLLVTAGAVRDQRRQAGAGTAI